MTVSGGCHGTPDEGAFFQLSKLPDAWLLLDHQGYRHGFNRVTV